LLKELYGKEIPMDYIVIPVKEIEDLMKEYKKILKKFLVNIN
jgi:hypothetical protein